MKKFFILPLAAFIVLFSLGAGCAGDAGGPVQRNDGTATTEFYIEDRVRESLLEARNSLSSALQEGENDTYRDVYDRVRKANDRVGDAIRDLEKAMRGKTTTSLQTQAYADLKAAKGQLEAALKLGEDAYQPTIESFRNGVERAEQSVIEALDRFGIR